MPIPPLILKIVADSSGVKAGVAQTNAQVSGLKNSVTQNAALIKTALVGGVVVGLAAAAKAASDLGESQNKANVIFGDSVGVVNAFASSAAEGFGLAKSSALEGAASFGAMFDSAGLASDAAADMSVKMSGLAGDMASFNNQDPSEMLDRLRSGLSGEAEPLRRFGVFISEAAVQAEAYKSGIAAVGAELTDAQKIQARYNIILQDTKKQQGDFARTLGESLPNQLRVAKAELTNLAASIGKVLLPAMTGALKTFNDLPDSVKLASAALLGLVGALTAVSVAAKALEGTIVAKLAAALSGPYAAAVGTAIAVGVQFNNTMKSASEDIAAADHAINTGRGGLVLWRDAASEATDATNAARIGFGDLGVQMMETQKDVNNFSRVFHDFAKMSTREQKDWASETIDGFDAFQEAFKSLTDAVENDLALTSRRIIQHFNEQARNVSDYRENLLEVASRNIPDELLQQLVELGLGGAGIMDELADASDRRFRQMVASMQGARNQTKGLEQDLKDLRAEAAAPIKVTVGVSVVGGGGINAGFRQHGGPVSAMRPYIVGEAGPELFVPRTAGSIVPNGGGGGGDLVLQVDGREIGRVAHEQLLKIKRSGGDLGLAS